MTFTRDSAIWWLVLLVTASTYLSTHFELLSKAFPAVSVVWESRLELAATLGGVVAGYLRMSPLKLSTDSELRWQGSDPNQTLSITGKQKPQESEQ